MLDLLKDIDSFGLCVGHASASFQNPMVLKFQ